MVTAAVVVALIAGSTAGATHVFSDVDDSRFYAGPVEWASTNKITTGTSATTFDPDRPVTRGESVTFLKRYHDNVGTTPGPVGPAGPAGPPGPPAATQFVPINFRGTAPVADAELATLNGISVRLDCVGGVETINVTTTETGSEISAVSFDASIPGLDPIGAFDDTFDAGDTFVAGPGAGLATDRQYTITYSAVDGRNVQVTLITEDGIGASDCVVSGFAIGAP